ncbi:histone-lysine N-methyltransferase, H3 lysine-79 specific [Apodospora peruviana]|uniref:Histone-lysine N-methyltransferase, H3 lysine-79 specific n=1 Tax=Apodospora peruviana TaxID=516989 RepID=A0AAE0IC04_9PEZI|nr:histone-lysine N-methyltransferase, H3 lysine-79 specific [Apodospora peruviana]
MSIFNQKSKFKVKTEVRSVRQAVEPKPKPKPKPASSDRLRPDDAARRASSTAVTGSARASPKPGSSSARLQSSSPYPEGGASRKRRIISSSRSPAASSPNFIESADEDDGDEDWEATLDARKRRKRAREGQTVDLNRSLRHPRLWTGEEEIVSGKGSAASPPPIIHAAEVASLEQKCQPMLGLAQDKAAVKLQYPGARYPERYQLVWGKDKIDAVRDIVKVVNYVASTYLTEDDASFFLDQNAGICRRLERSRNMGDGVGFKTALGEYNERLRSLQKKGIIAKNLDSMHSIPKELTAFILDQVYDRTVAPKVELLAKYKNGSDNVYGELLHPFISNILERTGMTSDKVFVDLGSGVGNVTLQAALEIGCESWGCEMMENACNLAESQQKEFSARCRLWGIAPGKVHLERGDFRKNDRILAALKRADVVLVNNQAFTSQLNDNLVSMFLDLKPGCKIISLKTFVHDNKNAENDVATSILDVEHLTYPEEYVSWTSASGTFCISTKR